MWRLLKVESECDVNIAQNSYVIDRPEVKLLQDTSDKREAICEGNKVKHQIQEFETRR